MKKALRIFVWLSLLTTGCQVLRETTSDSVRTEDGTIFSKLRDNSSLEPSVLQKNLELWRSKGIRDYDFVLHHRRFDPMMPSPTFEIKVRDGKAQSIRALGMKDVPYREQFTTIDTIDKLFDILTTVPGEKRRVSATFDPEFGYPLKIETSGKEMHSLRRWEVVEFSPQPPRP